MRLVGHIRFALGAGLCAALAACGGASTTEDGWEEVPAGPDVPLPQGDAPASPDRCPFPLDDVRHAQVGIRYVVEELLSARVLVVPIADGNPDGIAYAYEVRDERGYEAGTTSYVCDEAGLSLASSGTEVRNLAFEPPLPALSSVPRAGRTTGVATLTADGEAVAFPYTFEFDIASATTAGPMEGEPGQRVRVSTVLVLGAVDAETHIASDSLWLIGPTVLGIMERSQTTTGPDGVEVRRVERAGSLRR